MNRMNIPAFTADASLGPTMGRYRGKAVFGRAEDTAYASSRGYFSPFNGGVANSGIALAALPQILVDGIEWDPWGSWLGHGGGGGGFGPGWSSGSSGSGETGLFPLPSKKTCERACKVVSAACALGCIGATRGAGLIPRGGLTPFGAGVCASICAGALELCIDGCG